ncbi:MAG: polyprenyl synthetase family protein [Paludibacteraceae bacterium]|nr:polyprenyl synthetase family protein [Paludibacteraceae bacterium]
MDYSALIDEALHSLDWHKEPIGLYAPIEYALQTGGKRLRPQLVLMATNMFGGNIKNALNAALAIEVFHNFTLLHDDVMDNAPIRRGKPTVHKRWNANTAILSGDQMMIEAYTLLQDYPKEVWKVFNLMAREICEGQQKDMDFENRASVSTDEYIDMIRQKTSVLLGAALQIGAIIAGATEDNQKKVYNVGVNLGLAFQIQDDLLDCFGDPDTFGKQTGGDILENKKTWLLLTAQKLAADAKKENMPSPALTGNEKIRQTLAWYRRLGVPEKAQEAIQEYTNRALQQLAEIEVPEEKKKPLLALTAKLTNRVV